MKRPIAIAATLIACAWPVVAAETKSEVADGVRVTTFELPAGTVGVYLPADAAAGDRISGTVYLNPTGKGRSKLESHVLTLGERTIPVRDGGFSLELPDVRELTLVSAAGKRTAAALDRVGGVGSPVSSFTLPEIGQSGRWLRLEGPFDGDLANTRAAIGGRDALPLVESPRSAVFVNPTDVVGRTGLELWEDGELVAAGEYRNLDVQLSTPTTRLARGQQTTVTIEVSGLEELEEPARLEIEVTPEGVVRAAGGNRQILTIPPDQVGDEGRWARVVELTGVRPGSWDALATVIVDAAPAGRFALELEGVFAGWVAEARIEQELNLTVDLDMKKSFWRWIAEATPRDGELLDCDGEGKVRERHPFDGGVVTEVTIPALDASGKEPAYLTVVVEPERLRHETGDGRKVLGEIVPETRKWTVADFRIEIGDLPCDRVATVDSITWEQKVTQDEVGALRTPTKHPAKVALPEIRITLDIDDLDPWLEWIHGTPAGPRGPGLLELIPPAGREPLRIDLLDIAAVELIVSRPSAAPASRCEVLLEADRITFTGLE